MTNYERAKDIYDMLEKGQLLEAFEKYYHEDVVMVEATGETRKGKAASREYEKNFVSYVKEFHGMGVKAITSNDEKGIIMVESWMDTTLGDGNRVKMEQVSVQHWKEGQIIHERFYYNAGK